MNIQWFLFYLQSYATIITIYFQNIFITPKRNSIPIEKLLVPPPSSPPGLWPQFSSVQFSCSLRRYGLQHIRLPCPSPTPTACSNSCPLSQWCHLTIASSVVPFSFCPLSRHQSLVQWVSSSHQVAKVLKLQLQHQSFQWIFRTDFL